MRSRIKSKSIQVIRIAPAWLHRKLSNRQFLIGGAIVVGLWAGVTAVILKVSVHYLQEILKSLGHQYNWVFFVSPAIGILLTVFFVRLFLKENLARGTSHVLLAIAKKSSFIPRQEVISEMVLQAKPL